MNDRETLKRIAEAARECDREHSDFQARKLLIETPILLANGVTIQRWIPVEERLPEVGKIVLVYGSRGGIYTARLERDGRYAYWHKLNSKTHYCKPTHWMPLPQPPKEVE